MNFKDYKEKALTYYLNVEKKTENTVNTIRKQLNVFEKYIENNKLNILEVTFANLSDFIAEKGGKESTINARINALKKFFKYMIAMNFITVDPSANLKTVKVKTSLNDAGKVLTEDQMKRLLHIIKGNVTMSKSPKRDYALVLLALDMGLRRSEYTWLKISDFNFTGKRKSFRAKRKGGMIQTLPLHDNVAEAIQDYIENERADIKDDTLFLTALTNKSIDPSSMGRILGDLIAFLGLPSVYNHAHTLRHSACTSMLRRGMPVTTVQFIMNHKSIEQTLAYTHLTDEDHQNQFFEYGGFEL